VEFRPPDGPFLNALRRRTEAHRGRGMAIRMGKDHAFSTLQFLRNRGRPNDMQRRIAVRQRAAVQHAITEPVEGLFDPSGSSIRRQACSIPSPQSTLLKVPPKLAERGWRLRAG
jgi:hypothetical protein